MSFNKQGIEVKCMEIILLALANKTNERLVANLLKNNYNIQAYTAGTEITQRYDLIITDGKTLTALKRKYPGFKKDLSGIFQPVLLISSKKGVNLITARIWQAIDELVTTPISGMELFASVEILMRARRQSIMLLEKNAALRSENDALKLESNLIADCFANVSHELRTPLAVILSGIDFLSACLAEDVVNPETCRSTLEISKRNCHRLLRVINNLLDLTKIKSGYVGLSLRNVDLHDKLAEVVESVRDYASRKEITLSFLSDTRRVVAVDEDMFGRIMLNLLSNAIKFTPLKGVVSVILQDGGKGKIIITVKDNGIGIPSDKQCAIFDRFTQTDYSMTRRTEGCGLGLSLVRSLVELHDGRIWLESKPGLGSRFSFELPAKTVDSSLSEAFRPDIKERIYYEFSDL